MGRGHGYVQRFVLEALRAQRADMADPYLWTHAQTLCERLYGDASTRSQLESVRRAIRSLVAVGLVESDPAGVSILRAAEWPERPDMRHVRLVARIPLTKSDARKESKHVAAALKRYEAARAAAPRPTASA